MLLKTLNEMNEFLYYYFDIPVTTNVETVKYIKLTKFSWLVDNLEIYNITELIKVLYETDKLKRTTFSNDEKIFSLKKLQCSTDVLSITLYSTLTICLRLSSTSFKSFRRLENSLLKMRTVLSLKFIVYITQTHWG